MNAEAKALAEQIPHFLDAIATLERQLKEARALVDEDGDASGLLHELEAARAEISEWKVGRMADATGHLVRCAKVNGVWACQPGCAIQRAEAARRVAVHGTHNLWCNAVTRAMSDRSCDCGFRKVADAMSDAWPGWRDA